MTARKWSDIKARKFTPEELRQLDQEVASELLEMDSNVAVVDGKRIKLAEG
jgi:hypothetical protein